MNLFVKYTQYNDFCHVLNEKNNKSIYNKLSFTCYVC